MSHFEDIFGGSSKHNAAWLMTPFSFSEFMNTDNISQIYERIQEQYDPDEYESEQAREEAITEDIAGVLEENFNFFRDYVQKNTDANGMMNIFRAVNLKDISDLRINKLGRYWAYAENCAQVYFGGPEQGDTYIIHGRVHVNDVDWRESIVLNEVFGGAECEVRVVRNARVQLVGWNTPRDRTVRPLPTAEGIAGFRRR